MNALAYYDSLLEPPERDEPVVICPNCGAVLGGDDKIYMEDGAREWMRSSWIGCSYCIKQIYAEDMEEVLYGR